MTRGFPCNEYPLSNFRRFIAKSLPSSPVLYKRTASCMFQFASCLFQKAFDVRFWPCHQEVIDVSSCFSLRCVLDLVRNDRTSNRRTVTVSFAWNSRELSRCKCPKPFGAPLRPGKADTASHIVVWSQLCFWRRFDPNLAVRSI